MRGFDDSGALIIECPWQSEHSDGKTGDTSCLYYPRHTRGHAEGRFHCLHSHCQSRPQLQFTEALGLSVLDDFDAIAAPKCGADDFFSDAAGNETDAFRAAPAKPRGVIPPARHLTTDQANAQRLLDNYRERLLVVSDRVLVWDSMRWVYDEAIFTRYALSLSKIVHAEAAEWRTKVAKDAPEKRKNDARRVTEPARHNEE